MRAVVGTFAFAAALIVATPHQTAAATQQPTTTASSDKMDKRIDARVTRRINADASLKRHHVKVSVNDGVATLTGTVASDAQRARAERFAMAAGAARVENRIDVDRDAAKGTTGTLERKSREGAEKTKEGAEGAWDKTKDGASRAGAEVTDGWITTDLKTRIEADKMLRDGDIHVDTDHHIVTLTGSVSSAAARAKAVATARKIDGVTRVVDKLTIRR
jgi:osmotically-inducible protein OsmY